MINRRNILKAAGVMAVTGPVAMPAMAGGKKTLRSGMFEGRSDHVTSGSVKIVEENDRIYVELGDDFSLDNGPDPRVGFGKDGTYAGAEGYLGALGELTGKQRFYVPKVWDVAQFNEIYIWCNVADVPLGVASVM